MSSFFADKRRTTLFLADHRRFWLEKASMNQVTVISTLADWGCFRRVAIRMHFAQMLAICFERNGNSRIVFDLRRQSDRPCKLGKVLKSALGASRIESTLTEDIFIDVKYLHTHELAKAQTRESRRVFDRLQKAETLSNRSDDVLLLPASFFVRLYL